MPGQAVQAKAQQCDQSDKKDGEDNQIRRTVAQRIYPRRRRFDRFETFEKPRVRAVGDVYRG